MRRFVSLSVIATLATASALFAMPSVAMAQDPESIRVDVELKDADLLAATMVLTRQTGIQFVIEPSDEPFKRIDLSLKGQTAEDTIKYICQAAGASYRRDENGVYIISRKKPGAENVVQAPAAEPKPEPKAKTVRKIKILKGDPKAVFWQVFGSGPNPLAGFQELNNFKSMMGVSDSRFYTPEPKYVFNNNAVIPQSFSPASTQANPRALVEGGNGILLPGQEMAGQLGAPTGGGQGGGGRFGGGQGGQGLGGGGLGGGLGGGQGGGLGGQGGGQGFLQGGNGLVPGSIDFATYDPSTNSIIVRGNPEDIDELQRYIQLFDEAPRQVEIKVEFITTSTSTSKSLGFDWLYQRGAIFTGNRPGSFARVGDPIFINYATGNLTTRLRTLLQTGQGRVVQSPLVRTFNNQPGFVANSVQTTIFINQTTVTAAGSFTTSNPVSLPINTFLAVAPRINDDGPNPTITMYLNPSLQDFGQLRRGPDGQEIPDVLSQSIGVVTRVRNGDSVVLAGFTRKQDTGSQTKFPILGDLPIFGQFFRATNRDLNNSELLIFVTPRIIDEDLGTVHP